LNTQKTKKRKKKTKKKKKRGNLLEYTLEKYTYVRPNRYKTKKKYFVSTISDFQIILQQDLLSLVAAFLSKSNAGGKYTGAVVASCFKALRATF